MKFFRQPKNIFICTLALVALFMVATPTEASTINTLAAIVGNIVAGLVWITGQILIALMYLLIWVASYNDFVNSTAVTSGWVIVRDVCNMFFILILLVIAFTTVLNLPGYSWKKMLPEMLIMAVLINFSKLICGVIIDFAQVIMLTFVNGFRDIGGGNLTDMLGINKLLDVGNSEKEINDLSIMGTYVLALAYILIATAVITVILFVLVMRMVMLWILVTLSPLVYLLSALPNTKKYASKWWTQFTDNVVSGPILAFFIWLSFTSATADVSTFSSVPKPDQGPNEKARTEAFEAKEAPSAGLSTAGTTEGMLKFIISIGMLIGGLMITKELSGAVGSIAGKGLDVVKKGAKTLTGYNAVKDRIGAFNKQRDAARSEKINAFGERNFGRYLSVKGAARGTLKAGFSAAKGGVMSALDKTGRFDEPLKQYNSWQENRSKRKEENRKHKDNLRSAYANGKYSDGVGGEYTAHQENGRTYYRREKKDEAGKVIPGQYEFAEKDGKRIEKMGDMHYNVDRAWNQAMVNSRAYNNKREKGEIDKEKDKMANAGLTPAQLLGVLEDSSASDSKRTAAALALAVKEGFKFSGQVGMAQTLLRNKNNGLLSKQFNDDVDKKQAHLNYDLATPEGRVKFAKRREEGKFDVLEAGAYKNANVIAALKDSMTDKEFVKHAEKISAYSSKHDEAQKEGLIKHLDTLQSPIFDPITGEIDKARKVVPKITRNLNDTIRGDIKVDEVAEALSESFDNMSISDIAKLKPESLDSTSTNPEFKAKYDHTINSIIMNLSKADIANIRRVQDGNRETVAEIYRRWYLTNPDRRDEKDEPLKNGPRGARGRRQQNSRGSRNGGTNSSQRGNQSTGSQPGSTTPPSNNQPPSEYEDTDFEFTEKGDENNLLSSETKQLGP